MVHRANWKPQEFEKIWSLYPRKEYRVDAEKAWDEVGPSEEDIAAMEKSIIKRKTDPYYSGWVNGIGVPLLSVFLAHYLWVDDED